MRLTTLFFTSVAFPPNRKKDTTYSLTYQFMRSSSSSVTININMDRRVWLLHETMSLGWLDSHYISVSLPHYWQSLLRITAELARTFSNSRSLLSNSYANAATTVIISIRIAVRSSYYPMWKHMVVYYNIAGREDKTTNGEWEAYSADSCPLNNDVGSGDCGVNSMSGRAGEQGTVCCIPYFLPLHTSVISVIRFALCLF